MSIAKRVTYLKGLTEGLGLGNDTKEEKIIRVMIEILEDIAAELEEVAEDITALDDDVSVLVEDMQELEDLFFEDEIDASRDCPLSAVPFYDSPGLNGGPNKADEEKKPEPQFYVVQCPTCHEEITIDDDVLAQGAIDCPNCGERLELEE